MSRPRRLALACALRLGPMLVARFCVSRLSTRELGELGEECVARRLRRAGWTLVARRLPTPDGEIDIVARRPGVLACVEVKSARGSPDDLRWRPGLRIDAETLARQRNAARWLARRSGDSRERGRVDLYEVFLQSGRGPRFLVHADMRRPL